MADKIFNSRGIFLNVTDVTTMVTSGTPIARIDQKTIYAPNGGISGSSVMYVTRTAEFTYNSVKIESVFRYSSNNVTTIYANTDRTAQTFTFGVNARLLVVNGDGQMMTRVNSSALLPNDEILLIYDTTIDNFVGGYLIASYLLSFEEKVTHDEPKNNGVRNAIKKAYQMVKINWQTLGVIPSNSGNFASNSLMQGIIYSSAKETSTFVGQEVSFHTFMTAMRNPRSVLYTENINATRSNSAYGKTYHGTNCASFYGTVCSGLTGYAFGLKVNYRTYDSVVAPFMERVAEQSASGIELCDVLWNEGHVQLITDIQRRAGQIVKIEMSQASGDKCNLNVFTSASAFNAYMTSINGVLYRHTDLSNNPYTPLTEFVAVGEETLTPYNYNSALCPNKGDKSLYRVGENVVLNLFGNYQNYSQLVIKKDNSIYSTTNISSEDVTLTLPYGTYTAYLKNNSGVSDSVQFKVIDTTMTIDKTNNRIYFSSANSTPLYFEFCDIAGFRPEVYDGSTIKELTSDDIARGYIEVTEPSSVADSNGRIYGYAKIHFEDGFGQIINEPINWFA